MFDCFHLHCSDIVEGELSAMIFLLWIILEKKLFGLCRHEQISFGYFSRDFFYCLLMSLLGLNGCKRVIGKGLVVSSHDDDLNLCNLFFFYF